MRYRKDQCAGMGGEERRGWQATGLVVVEEEVV